jgi:hypothetical protein
LARPLLAEDNVFKLVDFGIRAVDNIKAKRALPVGDSFLRD